MIAMTLGIIAGVIFEGRISGIKLVGDIFLRLIQMSIVLLVMGQIIEAVGGLNRKELSRRGLKTVSIFFRDIIFSSTLWNFLWDSY